ncbi:ankyrin repeat-containing domain protein [Trichophaea hybrida]|nr:ankyrin repeat-containing domain protein [Trichophaea hybrida]
MPRTQKLSNLKCRQCRRDRQKVIIIPENAEHAELTASRSVFLPSANGLEFAANVASNITTSARPTAAKKTNYTNPNIILAYGQTLVLPRSSQREPSPSVNYELGYLGELLELLDDLGYDCDEFLDEFEDQAGHISDVNKTLEILWQNTYDDSLRRVEELPNGNQSWEAELLYERILAYVEPHQRVSRVRTSVNKLMAKLIDLYVRRGEFWAAIKMQERLIALSRESNSFDNEGLRNLYLKFSNYETELLQRYVESNVFTPTYKSSILSILPVSHRAILFPTIITPDFPAFFDNHTKHAVNIWHQDVLHWAARYQKYRAIPGLMKLGISITATSDIFGRSPIHWAAISGNWKTVNALITENFDMNQQDALQLTPLHLAVSEHHLCVIMCLINASADLSLTTVSEFTPLHCAVFVSNFEAAHLLLKNMVDASGTNITGDNLLHSVFEPISIDSTYMHEKKLLVEQLLEKGVDPCAENDEGHTPLRRVIMFNCKPDDEGHRRKIIDLLITGGADLTATDKDGRAPLHWALMAGDGKKAHPSTFEYLIQQGAQVSTQDKDGNTAMHFAARNGRADLFEILLNYRAPFEIENKNHETPYSFGHDPKIISILNERVMHTLFHHFRTPLL